MTKSVNFYELIGLVTSNIYQCIYQWCLIFV